MRYPEMVKTNARYRGPMESMKQTGSVLDIEASIAKLGEELEIRQQEKTQMMKDLFQLYAEDLPKQTEIIRSRIQSVKGGEI